jgi:hypothetical protein
MNSSLTQLPILVIGEIQPHSSTSDLDPVADRLLGFEVEIGAATPGEFEDHVLAHECELLRERGFEILLKEPAVPSVPLHVADVDPAHRESTGR